MERSVLPTAEVYLNGRSHHENALSRMVFTPEPDKGIVHTPREIAQQPLLWRKTGQQMADESDTLHTFLSDAGLFNEQDPATILLTGAGSSDYIGRSVADLLRTRLKAPVESYPTTRITASPDSYIQPNRRYVMVHFARSGNSPESQAVLDVALAHHSATISHVVITCNKDGALAELARQHSDRVYLIVLGDNCNDQGLAMTGSFTAMVTAAQGLAFLDKMNDFQRHINNISAATEYVFRTYADPLYELSDPKINRMIFLGNADLLGAATESALKVQELTAGAIMAGAEDTLAFRHGPISAVNGSTLVCFFLSAASHTRRYELDVLQQYEATFKEMGVRVLVVSGPEVNRKKWLSAETITYDPHGESEIFPYLQAVIATVIGQLIGLFSAYRRSINVDDPSEDNMLYNRTVQGVRIYPYHNTPPKSVPSNQ